jgi:hypothetical protein
MNYEYQGKCKQTSSTLVVSGCHPSAKAHPTRPRLARSVEGGTCLRHRHGLHALLFIKHVDDLVSIFLNTMCINRCP